jgi:hypothetical protein
MRSAIKEQLPHWKKEPVSQYMRDALKRKIRELELQLSNGDTLAIDSPNATQVATTTLVTEIRAMRWILNDQWLEMFTDENEETEEDIDEEDYSLL